MKSTRQVVHLVPCDATLIRILKIEAQTLGVIDRLFQFIPNLTLLALWRGLGSATNQSARAEDCKHLCYIKVSTL
jgi:hypothetical protein